MFGEIKIAPSILSADFMNLEPEIRKIEEGGAAYIHVDVMDGHFVPNLTIGVPIVAQLKKIAKIPLDVHLMISNPLEQLPWYLQHNPEIVTIHHEALHSTKDMLAAIDMIARAGVIPAVALKPDTPTDVLEPYIDRLGMVLIMSVFPGFSGQSYVEGSEDRVASVVQMARAKGCSPLIQVDGGIGVETAGLVAAAGADVLVCGNAVYKAPEGVEAAIANVTKVAMSAQKPFEYR